MLSKIFSLLLAVIISHSLAAQSIEYSGKIMDTTSKTAAKNAVVALLTPADSVFVKFTRSKEDGSFILKDIPQGKYILMVMHPTFADYVEDIYLNNSNENAGTISMTPKSKLLEAVILKSGSPIRIKGDTTIYTADSFKVSANANVEALLKKLPGIQVDKNGQIKAMGETVQKVLVDGEEFFGDDPGMAVKNLRADAVKEVQVFDKKSEQAEFTGIDDGKTQKTINLKLKEDKKTGYFGKISLSGGLKDDIDDRYNNNILLSSFKGKRKITGFYLNGNTGQDGLSWQDNEKYGGESDNITMSMDDDGGVMYMWRGGGSDDEPYVDTQNGYIKNDNVGVQYSNKWKDKYSFNFSPKFNSQVYNNNRGLFRQTQIGDSTLNEYSTTLSNINRYNLKNSASFDIKIDSNNSLKITLKGNFYHTENNEVRDSYTTGKTGSMKNASSRELEAKSDKTAVSSGIIFKHKFKKLRRTLSANIDWNMLDTNGDSYTNSVNESYLNGSLSSTENIDQLRMTDRRTQTLTSRIVYTEPLSPLYSLELAYEISYNHGNNNQQTYSYSPVNDKYDVMVDSLSNDFRQSISVNKPSFKINYSKKKVKWNIGSGIGLTHFNLEDVTFKKDYVRNYTNFFPAATFTYTYKSNHTLRANYNGYTTQPGLNQLQPLRDNNDKYNQYIGNPNLKPSFSNSINISHNSYNFLKDRWMYQSINFRTTSNAITTSRTINPDSALTITKPVNTNGNFNIGFWGGGGFKVKSIDTRFNFNPNLNYSNATDVINNQTSVSKTLSSGISLYISKSKDKKYDFSINNNLSYNSNKTSQQKALIKYYTNSLTGNATVYIKKVWSIFSDYTYYYRQKTPQFNDALNNQIWNAGLQRTFKNNEFTAFFKVRDILDQNIGITRRFSGNTLTEERNDRLRRYWLVGFSWDFKNKSASPVATKTP
ncbi:MAG: outer membrane beta-barrel family protein [Ferruginibacter sp.]